MTDTSVSRPPSSNTSGLLLNNQATFVAYEGIKPSSASKRKIRSHAMRFHRQRSQRHVELHGPEIRFGPITIPTSCGSQMITRKCSEVASDENKENTTTIERLQERRPGGLSYYSQADPLSMINHQSLEHSQLLSAFLFLYWPASKGRIQEHTDDWVAYLPFIDMSNPLLRMCTEAMCCVKLGVRYNSNECLKQYRSRYGLALPMLAKNLYTQTMRQDHLLAAMAMLQVCELFDPAVYGRDHIGWLRHAYGAIQFAANKGAETWSTPLGRKVCIFLRHYAFCTALCERKASLFDTPVWTRLMTDPGVTGEFTDLYNTIQPLPGLLEDMDSSKHDVLEQTIILGKFRDLFDKLELWYVTWHDDLDQKYFTRLEQVIEPFKEFQAQYGTPLGKSLIIFRSIFDCSTHLMYWLVKTVLVSNILDILPRTSIETSTGHFALQNEFFTDLENTGLASAMSFCQAIPYALEIHLVSLAKHIILATPLIEMFFLRFNRQTEAAWCHNFSQCTYRSWKERNASDKRLANEAGWTIESSEQRVNAAFEKWWLTVLFLK